MAKYEELIHNATLHASAGVLHDTTGEKHMAITEYEDGIIALDAILKDHPGRGPHDLFVYRRSLYAKRIDVLRAQLM